MKTYSEKEKMTSYYKDIVNSTLNRGINHYTISDYNNTLWGNGFAQWCMENYTYINGRSSMTVYFNQPKIKE